MYHSIQDELLTVGGVLLFAAFVIASIFIAKRMIAFARVCREENNLRVWPGTVASILQFIFVAQATKAGMPGALVYIVACVALLALVLFYNVRRAGWKRGLLMLPVQYLSGNVLLFAYLFFILMAALNRRR